ncbi:MAG: hypothetical protein R2758_06035 [Bacteroidales bacterium]
MTLRETGNGHLSEELDRIDIRPEKGMVKFVFARHYHGIQLDGATGGSCTLSTGGQTWLRIYMTCHWLTSFSE